jgi:predicted amidohydrolase
MITGMTTGMTIGSTVTIAAAAYPLDRYTTLDAYADKLSRWVSDAAGQGASLVVFPEYGAMEFACAHGEAVSNLQASLEAVSASLATMDAVHADLARRHRVYILAASGPARRSDGRYTNAARLIAPSGRIGVQDKMVMTPFETSWGIVPGSTLRAFDTALGRIAIAICYDSEFPLLVRAQAEAGASIILIPSCTEFVSGYHRVRTAALARALENSCVTVQSPTVGDARWSHAVDVNAGAAGIFVPSERGLSDTGVLAETAFSKPGFAVATVDAARLSAIRKSGEMRNYVDWARQPGYSPRETTVELIDLDGTG